MLSQVESDLLMSARDAFTAGFNVEVEPRDVKLERELEPEPATAGR